MVNLITLLPEVSDEEMAALQAEDVDLGPVIEWLMDTEPPPADLLKRSSKATWKLWGLVPMVQLENGVLIKRDTEDGPPRLVVPRELRKRLFRLTHAGPLAAHLGFKTALLLMQEKYFWPGMRTDIGVWCRQCPECAQSKGLPTKHKGLLQKVITGAPMDMVAVDILSGVPVTPDGDKYLLVLTDYFTKCYHLVK